MQGARAERITRVMARSHAQMLQPVFERGVI
jgi:hypothetical protein